MKRSALIILLGAFSGLLFAQPANEIDKTLPEFSFNTFDLAGEMHFLASDFLEGRRTGSNGNVIAGNYIAAQ
ncbi:MAG: peptidase M28, partial [Bacteroidota bacterium]